MWSAFFYVFVAMLIITIGIETVMIFDQEARLIRLQEQVHNTSLRVDATLWRADIVLKAQEDLLFGTCSATSTK